MKLVTTIASSCALALALAACGEVAASPSASPSDGATRVERARPLVEGGAEDRAGHTPTSRVSASHHGAPVSVGELRAAYEETRGALARDDFGAAKAAAGVLVKAAGAHASIAKAAATMISAVDIEALRQGFGATSKAYITTLAASPGMAKGLHVFRCPMAKGYQKWVQLTEGVSNPYMGQRMPKCGSETPIEP